MKAFVYQKSKDSKKMQEINNIIRVIEDKDNHRITFESGVGFDTVLDTRFFKTVIYQN